MADVSLGNLTAYIQADLTHFQRGMQQAQQQLAQFQQALGRQGAAASQAQQALAGVTQVTSQMSQQMQQVSRATSQVTQAMGAATQATSAWSQALQVASGIGLAVTIDRIVQSIGRLLSSSVTLAGRMQDLHRSFLALEGSGTAANRTLAQLFDLAQRAGVSFTGLAQSFRGLEAGAKGTTLSHQDLQRAMEGITLGARVMGLGTQENARAMAAWQQILTKGRLSSEELVQQLGEAIPGALNIVSRSLVVTTAQLRAMAEAGLIPGTVAFVAFSEEMRKLGQSTGAITSLSATFERLKNETTAWLVVLGEAITNKLQPFLDKILEISEALRAMLGIRGPGQTAAGTGPATAAGPYTARTQFPIAPSPYTELIQQQARRSGVDPGLASQVMRVESGFQADIEGPLTRFGTRAQGLMQLLLTTAQELEMGVTEANIREPARNIRLGMTYLGNLLEQFRGFPDQVQLALAAYNAGPARIETLLNAARQAGTPTTYAAIAPGLPPETQQYVGRVLDIPGMQAATAGQAQQQQAAATNQIVTAWQKNIADTLEQFGILQKQVDALNQSGANFGGIMSREVAQAAERVLQKLVDINQAFATLPALSQALPASLRDAVVEATRQGAIWKEMLLTDQQRAALLERQVDSMEQVVARQKTQLVSQRQGQEAAEQFARAEAARLQGEKLEERVARAGMTLTQQINADAAKLQALQNQAAQLSAELEVQRVTLLRPQLESQLQRIETFLDRPGQSRAEQARANILAQGRQMQADLLRMMAELARHPALQDLQEQAQHALQGFGEQVERQAGLAFEGIDRQMRDLIRGIDDQIDQIGLRTGAAGFRPLEADLARIRREFAGMVDRLQALDAELQRTRVGATPERQQEIDVAAGRIEMLQTQMAAAEARAILERQERDGRRLIETMQQRLEQLQELPGQQGFPLGETRETLRLRQAAEKTEMTPDQQRRVAALREQVLAQEQLNYGLGLFVQLAGGIESAWTSALESIATGTRTVSEAFREMARSILQSLAQIASQEAFRALIRMGVGLISNIALGSAGAGTGAIVGPETGAVGSVGYGINPVLFQHGGMVTRPTLALLGENPAHNPEMVLNRQQLDRITQSTATSAGSQGAGGVTIMNYPSRQAAEEQAAQQRAQGKTVILNEVLSDLSRGEASQINRMMRTLAR